MSTKRVIDDQRLPEAVRRMLAAGSPEKIILFGSRARGDARPESDFDFLVVEHSGRPRYERAVPYFSALAGLFPEEDVVVWTPEEIEAWSQVPNHFITKAYREGVVLYERS